MSTELLSTGSAYGLQPSTRMSMGMQKQLNRAVERLQGEALIAALTEEGRARLTNMALENIGALTALEQHLVSVAPLGEARYRELVDSCTLGAAAAIRRWGSC